MRSRSAWQRLARAVLLAILVTGLAGSGNPSMAKPKSAKAGSVRVYRFDDLDVEGNVKTPQLLYFLKRIRNKFRSFRLPKQHFLKQTLEDKNADFL